MVAPLIVNGRVGGRGRAGTALGAPLRGGGREPADADGRPRGGGHRARARAYERELGERRCCSAACCRIACQGVLGGQIAARYMPGGADVGGDWYDAVRLEDGRLGVAMGDVVGHGIGAAALMGQLRHATRAYALEGLSPGVVLDRLDQLVRSLDDGQMATLIYLVVEPDLRSLRLASAGHVPPLVVGPDGRGRFLDKAPDPPLGVFDTGGHAELAAELDPGSTLVLYTDGLVEGRGVDRRGARSSPGGGPKSGGPRGAL